MVMAKSFYGSLPYGERQVRRVMGGIKSLGLEGKQNCLHKVKLFLIKNL